jgi:hypothetical protein
MVVETQAGGRHLGPCRLRSELEGADETLVAARRAVGGDVGRVDLPDAGEQSQARRAPLGDGVDDAGGVVKLGWPSIGPDRA